MRMKREFQPPLLGAFAAAVDSNWLARAQLPHYCEGLRYAACPLKGSLHLGITNSPDEIH